MTGPGETTGELLARVDAWVDEDPHEGHVELLKELAFRVRNRGDAGAETGLREMFRTAIEFGTAGLRGEVGPGPNAMNRVVVRKAAFGVAQWVLDGGAAGGVVVCRDHRHGSEDFVADTIEVLAGAGITVHVLPAPNPTPVLAFAVRHLGAVAGVMVTASHNPGKDNGYKVYDGEGRQIDGAQAAAIATAMAAAPRVRDITVAGAGSALIVHHGLEVVDSYVGAIGHVVRPRPDRAPIEVAHTALHGVGAPVVRRACHLAGFITVHEVAEQADADAEFPTVSFPNPEEPGALDKLLDQAAWSSCDVALANDPDADRLALAALARNGQPRRVEDWRVLTGDQLGCLLADHLVRRGGLPDDAVFATTIVSSTMLRSIADDAGVAYAETLTGFKWIVRAAPGRSLAFGYEEALGYCVGDVVRDKDGISALLLACEMISDLVGEGLTVWDRLDDLARRFGVHVTGQWSLRLEGADGAQRIADAMARLRSTPPVVIGDRAVAGVSDLADGIPERGLPPADVVGLALPGARVVVRPSGTEPKLKCYVEVVEAVADGAPVDATRRRAESGLAALIASLPAALGLGLD